MPKMTHWRSADVIEVSGDKAAVYAAQGWVATDAKPAKVQPAVVRESAEGGAAEPKKAPAKKAATKKAAKKS